MASQGILVTPHGEFEILHEKPPESLVRRFLVTIWQFLGLLLGGMAAFIRYSQAGHAARGPLLWLMQLTLFLARPFLDRELIEEPFPVQFRRRLEMLGPTYIKLGQILSLRDDLLPKPLTDELKNLLDRLPIVTFDRFKELVQDELEIPVDTAFAWIDPYPIGSASLGQTHRARLQTQEEVVLKVLKPGVRQQITKDCTLLRLLGRMLQLVLARYQPRRLINEFCNYTLREVDLRFEAENAETFAANFEDLPDVTFPKIYAAYSSQSMLCMEFFSGKKPSSASAALLPAAERRRIVDLGVSSIIRMIFQDGFFHADLHPGNMLLLDDGRVGFIDLGMVGRFDDDTRKRMFNYFYSLVMGDPASAARYLTSMTVPVFKSDPDGFRRAVEDLNRRFFASPNFEDFSVARLILESIALAGRYYMYYPGEIVLMAKALVTIEGVGYLLDPEIDVTAVSRNQIRSIFIAQFNPLPAFRTGIVGVPDLLDTLMRSPVLISESLRMMERNLNRPTPDPVRQLRGPILAGFCLVAGAILASFGGPWFVWSAFFILAVFSHS
ncbi:MAG: phosphotransferase [Caldilineaceae bacterium]|nr:phosphotransferase [Caldilineaceae bacterium]